MWISITIWMGKEREGGQISGRGGLKVQAFLNCDLWEEEDGLGWRSGQEVRRGPGWGERQGEVSQPGTRPAGWPSGPQQGCGPRPQEDRCPPSRAAAPAPRRTDAPPSRAAAPAPRRTEAPYPLTLPSLLTSSLMVKQALGPSPPPFNPARLSAPPLPPSPPSCLYGQVGIIHIQVAEHGVLVTLNIDLHMRQQQRLFFAQQARKTPGNEDPAKALKLSGTEAIRH